MEQQLTLPLLRVIFKPLSIVFLIFLASCAVFVFLPASPEQLTLINQSEKQTYTQCPERSKTSLTTPVKQLTTPFTLLNWNIYKQQKAGWKRELQQWAEKVDIITLQEAKLSPELIKLSQQNHLFYQQNYAFKYDDFIHGVNTLSKVQPLSSCGSSIVEPWIRVPKTALATTYLLQDSDQPLLVINLHGINFTFAEQDLREQLSPYLTLIAVHNGPVVFSGDFNTWSDTRLSIVEQALTTLGFSEVLFAQDRRLTILELPLDHVYYRGLKVLQAQSLATEASDHTPQLITFTIEK